ncbi:MAG: SDR family NAD(P)-dependent oxidoreductase [Waterburya sp.]
MNAQTINKIALITGANKGLGLGIARKLGKQGITVLIAARDESRGKKAVDKLQFEGIDAHFIKLNVGDHASIKSAKNAIAERFGQLDILVNNAGVNLEFSTGLPAPSQVSLDILQQTFDINFWRC